MNKEIQVLYTIFELELAPPFELNDISKTSTMFRVYNRYSTCVGTYVSVENRFTLMDVIAKPILERVKQVFNVGKLSNEEVYNIAKHLVIWIQDKLPGEIDNTIIRNHDKVRNVHFFINKK